MSTTVLERIRGLAQGELFTAADFIDLGGRGAIHQVLSRAARNGEIRKIARGLYDLPTRDPELGVLSPREDSIIRALAERDAVKLQAAGAAAASSLGLTTQVPQKLIFLTDGRSQSIQVGKRQILLRRASPRQMATAGRISGTVIQALRWIGRENVSASTETHLRRKLAPTEKVQLLEDLRYAPAWIAEIMRRIAAPARD